MGLLSKLFGRKPKQPKLTPELENMMNKIQQQVFPGGKEQIEKELKELCTVLHVEPNKIRGTFGYACTRFFMGCDKQTLVDGIARHKDGLTDGQIELFARFVITRTIKQSTGITDDLILGLMSKAAGANDAEGDYDEIPGGFGEFGLTETNPVPVNGVIANEMYLSRLVSESGYPLCWHRVGSTQVSNIKMPVDIYEITDNAGVPLPTIYISSYHPRMSNRAPKGFKIK